MTAKLDEQLERRPKHRRGGRHKTFHGEIRYAAWLELEFQRIVQWPSPRWRTDPVRFFREVLGVEPWSRQIEVIEAVRDHPRVAVRSGHKVSKSHTAGGLSLWFYSSFEDARVVMTSTTARQVDQILWREFRMMHARAGLCVECKARNCELGPREQIERPCEHSALIGGVPGELARTGLKSPDFREVVGFTAREAEAIAGYSGRNVLFIVDEASGVPAEIFEAIEGNRAGGARVALWGNPTQNEGEHYAAFHTKKEFYFTATISSEESPNVVEGRDVISGLATRDWIEEKKREWGEDSALYKIRVKGVHAEHEEGKIFSVHAIGQAEARWWDTPEAGRLFVGLDPAGPSGFGDETVGAPRRGLKILALRAERGLDENAHLAWLLRLLGEFRLPREVPVVVLDRDGDVGAKVYYALRDHAENHPNDFELVAVRSSDKAARQPSVYDRMRDELTGNFEAWIKEGGAIPEDVKLAAEMHAPSWILQVNGRLKVTAKDQLRKLLGRSPDRYDASALSAWEPLSLGDAADDESEPPAAPDPGGARAGEDPDELGSALDPYDAGKTWR
jgi:phage terminase large subunit